METLPIEALEVISSLLTAQELAACCAVSGGWREAFNQDLLWRRHCDRPLEEYLRTTPAVVKPIFVSPESEGSTLSPVCQWRLAFMRENHLWNNWRTGKYKTQVITTEDTRPNVTQVEFLTNNYIVLLYNNKIEIWDLTTNVITKLAEKCTSEGIPHEFDECLIGGNNKELIILTKERVVMVCAIDVSRGFIIKHIFLIDEAEKISEVDGEIMFEQQTHKGDPVYCTYYAVGVQFVAVMGEYLYLWDLETGLKLKTVKCPINEPYLVKNVVHSETSKDVIVVAKGINDSWFGGDRHYFVYSFTHLAFLPFSKRFNSITAYQCCIDDCFVGINDSNGIRVYNYKTTDLLFEEAHFETSKFRLQVIKGNFVFGFGDSFEIFNPLDKSITSFPVNRFYVLKVLGGRFLALLTHPIIIPSNLWEFGHTLKLTGAKFSGGNTTNRACTRIMFFRNYNYNNGYKYYSQALFRFGKLKINTFW